MTDRHEEAIEKAAKAIAGKYWMTAIQDATAAVTAYLEHAHPALTTVEDVEDLPVGVILRDAEGTIWETGHEDGIDYLCPIGSEDGYGAGEVPLPARVIWWPDTDA